MEKDLASDHVKKRLEELEILENYQKEKIEKLNKEKRKEIKKTLTKGQKIMMVVSIIAWLGLTSRWGREYLKSQKEKESPKIENIQPNKNIVPEVHMLSQEKLQKAIKDSLLEEEISYKDICEVVNQLTNENSKKEIIDFLYAWNIVWMQEYLGMEKDSKFSCNKSTGRIDQNTMSILSWKRFGIKDKEIFENDSISEDVKDAYKEFMEWTINNNNQNYVIESKISMSSYVFDKEHRLIDLQPILVGKDLGKDQEFVPYPWFYEKGIRKYYNDSILDKINTNTPEWLFSIEGLDQLRDEDYSIEGPREAIILIPIILTTKGLNYDTKKIKLWIHPTFLPKHDREKYLKALATKEISDNNQSHWCINVANFGRIKHLLNLDPKNGSRVYITQYNKYKNRQQQKYLPQKKGRH